MNDAPIVSVITPLYNSSRWVDGLLDTMRAQTLLRWQHIVVDDGSTDDGVGKVEAASAVDPRVKLIRLSCNSGPSRARNVGLAAANTRFVAFLDADDRWVPEKLERQLKFMQQECVGFSYHDYVHLSEDGTRIGRSVKGPNRLDWVTLHKRRGVGCLSVVIDRTKCADPSFPEDTANLAEDFQAWSRLLKGNDVKARRLNEVLGFYRIVGTSRSSAKKSAAISVWRIYRDQEDIPVLRAAWYWLSAMLGAAYNHFRARPSRPLRTTIL
ncbi:glycosyltransferase family 2 protein [Devosia sp. MC532]|uniref:glycosyltransferase family 2 protein n=1 Tax=Devosia sp. MC532 TaxID=2799788 RepID=UPI0018F43CE4|nr:glycosyltransferase family 2 protein [Devosia sp. MC532]MBJ7579509.1 glycosyltransferase family 2 protein [Devosia sp. MC532]